MRVARACLCGEVLLLLQLILIQTAYSFLLVKGFEKGESCITVLVLNVIQLMMILKSTGFVVSDVLIVGVVSYHNFVAETV